jgi:hypothetical protein
MTTKKMSVTIKAAWIVGICAVISAIITAVALHYTNPSTSKSSLSADEKSPGKLEITDILVDRYRHDFTNIVDFRIINRGDFSSSISRVKFKVLDISHPTTGTHRPTAGQSVPQ